VRAEAQGWVTGTRNFDEVTYAMKMGQLGALAHSLFVERQMRSLFAHRQKRIAEIFARIEQAGVRLNG
ncbi:hypothetical protein, partial [Silvibacterium sp.]|uniref:hypothetical protein n=1 Tax=Silvibacterium sp. TaxID=1964179 RepID=UPI0039E38291